MFTFIFAGFNESDGIVFNFKITEVIFFFIILHRPIRKQSLKSKKKIYIIRSGFNLINYF